MALIAARPDLFSRQGYLTATFRCRNGKRFGPYYLLNYREQGRLRSIYLGRPGALVEQVREALKTRRRPVTEFRLFERLVKQIRASLRIDRLRVGALLRPFGLRLKGSEVRGWWISPLRWLLPHRRRLYPSVAVRTFRLRPQQNHDPAARLHRFLYLRDGYVPQDEMQSS